METEELVILIQQGKTELYQELWLRLEKLIQLWARQFFVIYSSDGSAPGGYVVEDFVQTGYFAILNAVDRYEPGKAKFTTFLFWYVRNAFQRAIGRADNLRKEPLDYCSSLDVPIADDSETTYGDLVADPSDHYSMVDDKVYNEELHEALENALIKLPVKEAAAIRSSYFEGKQLREIGKELHCSKEFARQLRNNGIKRIRKSSSRRALERFVDQTTNFYLGVSIEEFNTTHSSATEKLVFLRDASRKKYRRQF